MHNVFTFNISKSMNHKKKIHYEITEIIVCLQLEMFYLLKSDILISTDATLISNTKLKFL